MSTWRVIRFGDGTYCAALTTQAKYTTYDTGKPGGSMDSTKAMRTSLDEATARAARLNGKTPTMSDDEFTASTAHVTMTEPMRTALRMILVGGRTWAHAAATNKLTQSGIKRAMDRVRAANVAST